jgi:heme/copper-type cytochrome/quinol oxidase subunit 2
MLSSQQRKEDIYMFMWTALLMQIIVVLFWIFIFYGFVMLIRNSNANKKLLQGIEKELQILNLHNEQLEKK